MSTIALVVGGGSGIGAASAARLAEQGHRVAVADLDAGAAARIAGELPGDGHLALVCDIADEASVRSCFDQVESGLGGIRVLVVTAGHPGLIDGKRPSIIETTMESWSRVQGVNTTGSFLAIREMLSRRRQRPVDNGRIILMSSVAGQSVARHAPITYASSKAAVLAMARVAAGDAEPLGMTVNAIAPGMIDTPMLRAGFPEGDEAWAEMIGPVGQPDDIAAAVCFLASPEARLITGACIDVNGGFVMR